MGYVVAKYIRLSIEDAKTESMSIEHQNLILDSHIAGMNEPDIEVLEFVDNGFTGTNFERPAVQELLELVRAGTVNCIAVKDFSRFGRNMIEAGYFLQRVFPLFRVRFIAVSNGYDSADHEGDTGGLDIAFKLLLNERYSRDLSKKIKASKQAKALRGEYISKNCAFGFKKAGNHLEIDQSAAETVRLIFDLAAQGQSLTKIAARLYEEKRPTPSEHRTPKGEPACIWGRSVIAGILRDEQYIGTYVAGKTKKHEIGSRKQVKVDESEWIKIPNHHPVIVDKTIFDAAREKIDRKGAPLRNRKIGTSERYGQIERPLRGKVSCGCCGHIMRLSNTRNAAFHCQHSHCAPDEPCYRLRFLHDELSALILKAIRKQVKKSNFADLPLPSESALSCQITEQKKVKLKLYESFVREEITADEYKAGKATHDAEIDRLTRNQAALREESRTQAAVQNTEGQLRELLETSGKAQKLTQPLVDLLIDRVHIYPDGKATADWKIPGFDAVVKG